MPDSTSEAVGDAAKTAIEGIGLTRTPVGGGAPEAIPVVKRKHAGVPKGDVNGLPQVVVSVGEEGATEYLSATQKLKSYPVNVAIVTPAGNKHGDDATVRKWREDIEEELDKRASWATVSGFNAVDVVNREPFDRTAMAKDQNYSLIVATVSVVEART